MQTVEKALWVIERTRELGRMDGTILARTPGWDRIQAHRYLTCLSRLGWLERVNTSGRPRYVLGPKVLTLSVDLGL